MTNIDQLPDTTRVWVYQANQPFPESAWPAVKGKIQEFANQWVSHNRQLRSYGDLLHGQFVVLMVDESQADASGCSIDKSVYFLKQLQAEYGIDLFDRMTFTYKDGEEVKTAGREAFSALYQQGKINDDTLVFDTLVNNKKDFDAALLKPLSQSWHKRMV
jgi:hypothetical protein